MIHLWAFYSGISLWLLIFQLQLSKAKMEILTFPLEVTLFPSHARQFSASCHSNPSLPILSLPSRIWLSFGYYSCSLSGQAFLPIHAPRIHSHYSHHNTYLYHCNWLNVCRETLPCFNLLTSPPAALKALLILFLLIHHNLKSNIF